MAINSADNQSNDSRNWQVSNKAPLSYNESITSSASSKRQRKKFVSPYLNSDKVKLHSRVTEKKVVQRTTTDFTSSFPLAVNIYKANSDEFKIAKRASKKGKKCVHTLLNDPTAQPQTCTVSDMNDSEYNETKILRKPKPKVKKRRVNKNNPDKNIEIYDRDAKYCSQFNINLDSSSSDMFQHLTGDGRKVLKKPKNIYGRNQVIDNDVWAVLRNINKMQFIPSPPMSGTSIDSLKNMSTRRRTSDRTEPSFIETCRTEEFAYISYDNTSPNSHSRSSSFDRVTVIGKQDDVTKTYTYTKRGVRDQQRKREVLGNKKSKKVSKILSNTKPELNNKKLQQKLKIKEDVSLLQENIIHRDENLYRNSEQKLMAVCASEVKRNAENILKKADPEKSSIASESERQEQLNGITRVVLSKGIELHDSKNDCKQREARKCQSKSTSPIGKRTQIATAELRKQIGSLKYPIIVTGKEKLSSYTLVNDYKPPQFLGLDKHIWPFMIKWLPESQKATISIERKTPPEIARTNKLRTEIDGFRDGVPRNNSASCKLHNNDKLKKNKNQLSSQPISEKEKPMRIFRDKMLNLMYSNKYSIMQNAKSNGINNNAVKVKHHSFNIETQTPYSNIFVKKDKYASPAVDTDLPNINSLKSKSKHSWSKAKWASDFIENVIRKVKCGVYYGQESKKIIKSIYADSKLTQTDNLLTDVNDDDEKVLKEDIISNQFCYNGVIPGFEDKIQELKLETFSKSQIAVKHCNTNVVVQFDIALPIDTNGILQKDSKFLLPTEISASRIYKYKATITNAILPAELCSIFPKMLSNIFDSNIAPLSPQLIINDIQCHDLFPIKELTQHECLNTFNKVSMFNLPNIIPPILLQSGRFSDTFNNVQIFRPKMLNHILGHSEFCNILPQIKTKALFENISHVCNILFKSEPYEPKVQELTVHDVYADNIKNNTCTAIVPYVPNQSKILDLSDRKELKHVKTNSYWCVNFDLGLLSTFKVECFGTQTVVSLNNNSNNTISFIVNNLTVELLYNYYENVCNKADSFFYDDKTDSDGLRDRDTLKSTKSKLMIKKINRRSCVKLCKKCKSTSSIPQYKRNTPLQKIANLHEFFQALGSAKSLADAIDGDTERKILLSVVEMKAWITEITPRQALMILLLANKKETSNIIRFRNVILQGIATNRITKISELDMEIEVIERENLNNSVLLQGISYVPASTEDNLLEELCWIAKTTASDYQKPFDKTSERLLKSLLGKRKKLNPSYLRVMARYVGLGLLKSK